MTDRGVDDEPWWAQPATVGTVTVRRGTLAIAVGLAICVLLVVAAAPALGYGRPVNQLPLADVDPEAELEGPDDDGWEEVDGTSVPLAPAESGAPRADNTTIEEVQVDSAHDGDRLYVRLTWEDDSPSMDSDDPRAFGDAVALQFLTDDEEQPAIAMGSEESPVNVWYWRSDVGTQDLAAAGAGTTSYNSASLVDAEGTHNGDEWQVVFTREVDVDEDGHASIHGEDDLSVAVAVWDGANMERGGMKAISEWHHYPLGPGPFVPPWETLLWTVAGLAVVGVAFVTIYGIRQASAGARSA